MSTPRIAVSDDQFSQIMRACDPLAPLERSALLAALAHRLRGYREVGDGELHRLIREILRETWSPPRATGSTVHRTPSGPAIPLAGFPHVMQRSGGCFTDFPPIAGVLFSQVAEPDQDIEDGDIEGH
jgi:hypothetical protein